MNSKKHKRNSYHIRLSIQLKSNLIEQKPKKKKKNKREIWEW